MPSCYDFLYQVYILFLIGARWAGKAGWVASQNRYRSGWVEPQCCSFKPFVLMINFNRDYQNVPITVIKLFELSNKEVVCV